MAATGHDGLRDTINLHRFVLLKNSITQAESPSSSSGDRPNEALVFPDTAIAVAANVHGVDTSSSCDSEEKWLESVLETLDDDFDSEVEVEVHPVEEDDIDFSDTASDDLFEAWTPPYNRHSADHPSSVSQDLFVSSPSAVLSQPYPQPPLQRFFDSPDSPFNQPFVEPRYPEADLDLPMSEASDDDEDDDGPLTPYSGSRPSLVEQVAAEPGIYVERDSYFLYPSELDLISTQPLYYQHC